MGIRAEIIPHQAIIHFLLHCYSYVCNTWQHAVREPVPDQGFEKRFRESCISQLAGWQISSEREMNLGQRISTSSGVLHEIDIVGQHSDINAFVEIKNRAGWPPEKNDVIVFYAKIFDYMTSFPDLLIKEICPVVLSSNSFEESGLAACIGLGIHPVAPGLRPLPLLIYNLKCMEVELMNGLLLEDEFKDKYQDLCAYINCFASKVDNTWVSNRCSRLSEDKMFIKSIGGLNTIELVGQLRFMNRECTLLLSNFRKNKGTKI